VHSNSVKLSTADVSFDSDENIETAGNKLNFLAEFAKNEEQKSSYIGPPRFHFVNGVRLIPKNEKGGEDAFFTTDRAIGVADGVSGWYQYGIDSSKFSTLLMENCRKYIRMLKDNPIDLTEILKKAYSETNPIGSSTATLCVINGDKLNAINLGDSGFILFRQMDGEYLSYTVSKEQAHNFNTPFQLSRAPTHEEIKNLRHFVHEDEITRLHKMLENDDICQDKPEDCDKYEFVIKDSDIIVLGTDGIFLVLTILKVYLIIYLRMKLNE